MNKRLVIGLGAGLLAAAGIAAVLYGVSWGSATIRPAATCPEPAFEPGSFRHQRSSAIASGTSSSRAVDAVAAAGGPFEVVGKFAYGTLGQDLEDEEVVGFVRAEQCGEWTELGRGRTDDDGYVRFTATAPSAGVGSIRLYLPDATFVESMLLVLDPESPVAIFDLDGTLTVDDGELFEQVLGTGDAEAYEGASDVVRYWAENDTAIIYVTGRPDDYAELSRRWLDRHGFPRAPIMTTTSVLDASGSGVEAHKLRFLDWVVKTAHFRVRAAYGNATTDVCAYSRAGLDLARTFIVGPHAGTACDGFGPTRALGHYRRHHERLLARSGPDEPIADE